MVIEDLNSDDDSYNSGEDVDLDNSGIQETENAVFKNYAKLF